MLNDGFLSWTSWWAACRRAGQGCLGWTAPGTARAWSTCPPCGCGCPSATWNTRRKNTGSLPEARHTEGAAHTTHTHMWQARESYRAGGSLRQSPPAQHSLGRARGVRGGRRRAVPYLRRCASWQVQCQAFLESVRVSSLSKGKLRGSWVSRLFSR